MELFTYSYSYFGPFFRKQKGFYLQKSMKCKNFESQYRKIAQNADRTLKFQGDDVLSEKERKRQSRLHLYYLELILFNSCELLI